MNQQYREKMAETFPFYTKWFYFYIDDYRGYKFPCWVIAEHRAARYAHEFEGSLKQSLTLDTLPLFKEDKAQIYDWAFGNMDWDEIEQYAVKFDLGEPKVNMVEQWNNPHKTEIK
jgi:hypothetical protein